MFFGVNLENGLSAGQQQRWYGFRTGFEFGSWLSECNQIAVRGRGENLSVPPVPREIGHSRNCILGCEKINFSLYLLKFPLSILKTHLISRFMLAGALRRRESGAKNHFPGRIASARDVCASCRVYRHKSFLIRGVAGGEQPSDLGRIWDDLGSRLGLYPQWW